MMRTINIYLSFSGNCREAMNFYQKCLGGALIFQTVAESPLAGKMPEKMKKCILHAELRNENMVLMASDMVREPSLLKGNNVSLLLNCTSETELEGCYKKLSQEAKQTYAPILKPDGAIFGELTDKFGNYWMLNYRNTD